MTLARYARAVERRWREIAGEDVLLSPRDWSRISRWFAQRIPLGLIEDVLAEAGTRRSLAAVSTAVEQAWSVVLEGRRTEPELRGTPQEAAGDGRWRHRIEIEPEGSPLARLLEELLEQRADGAPARVVDEELDRRLAEVLDGTLADRVRQEVERELTPYRARMPTSRLDSTRRRATVERARRLLDLPRLADGGGPR